MVVSHYPDKLELNTATNISLIRFDNNSLFVSHASDNLNMFIEDFFFLNNSTSYACHLLLRFIFTFFFNQKLVFLDFKSFEFYSKIVYVSTFLMYQICVDNSRFNFY